MTDPRDPFGDEFPPTEPFTPLTTHEQAIVEQPTAAMTAPVSAAAAAAGGAAAAASAASVPPAGPSAPAAEQPIIVDQSAGPRTPSGAARAWAGILSSVRTHPRAWIAAGATAAVLIVGGGSFAAGSASGAPVQPAALKAPAQHSATPTASATPSATPTPTGRPVANPAAPAAALKTCSVAGPASDGRLGTLEAQVVDAKTGQVLFDRNGGTPAPTASVMKTITAGAALTALGANTQIATTVVKGSQPGQVVIVGGGDPTLSAGHGSWFQGAPTLTDLADQVKKAWAADPANAGQPITSVVADATLFGGPMWQPTWDEKEERASLGSTAYIAALMADGDKGNPNVLQTPRGTDPVGDAGKAFAQDLGASYDGQATAPKGAAQLGVVKSQPISSLVTEALENSDNTVMEMLARLTAIKEGAGNTFGAIDAGDTAALKTIGVDLSGLTIIDGSGLSGDNRVPPSFFTGYLTKILNRENGLGVIYDALPISGQTGTLTQGYGRFTGAASVAVGKIHAKTGSINGAYTLAGVINAKDGSQLVFAIYALGNVGDSARGAIDQLAASIYNCGDNLSNS
ncbi:D-alanyl-D-alanine carboxypeptidase/D-alanyl-D-alanine-endopeptidase [Gryllotalpicola daejeonensis]|uniref:D-alanyl-D-alanine carboxypeptidase/D-alanyl-D-alanine-endopeptidase n=1 Tax=Gryllotalpicola daejeonensis TaxID=993087 RepID=UPI0031D854BB